MSRAQQVQCVGCQLFDNLGYMPDKCLGSVVQVQQVPNCVASCKSIFTQKCCPDGAMRRESQPNRSKATRFGSARVWNAKRDCGPQRPLTLVFPTFRSWQRHALGRIELRFKNRHCFLLLVR